LMPRPSTEFGNAFAGHFSASMDSSDGLAISLYTIAEQSGVDIVIDSVPIFPGVEGISKENDLDANSLVFYGSEEYRVVATIPGSRAERIAKISKARGIEFHVIGRVKKGGGRVFLESSVLQKRGYDHFA